MKGSGFIYSLTCGDILGYSQISDQTLFFFFPVTACPSFDSNSIKPRNLTTEHSDSLTHGNAYQYLLRKKAPLPYGFKMNN